MPDTPLNNTQPSNMSQYEGVSNPPNGGQVDDVGISVPNANEESTVPQTAAPSTPPPQQTPQPQQVQQQSQPIAQQGQQTGQQPDLSKPPKGATPPVAPQPAQPSVPPMVQKASIFHDVAETLAGGPRYTYSVDAYGNMQRQQLPVSSGHLALAIAMEALGGAASGLSVQNGPNATGRAFGAGFQTGMQQRQAQDQQAKQQASQDFARRAQVAETNMRMYTNARLLGKQDAENIDGYVGQYKDLVNKLQTEYPGYIKGIAKYSDLSKYNATVDTAIPYMRVPRLDENGKQVELNGVPQWDVDYMILDPSFKASGLMTPDALKTLNKWGVKWADNPNVPNTPMNATLALNKMSQAAHLSTAESTLDNYWKTLDEANSKGSISNRFSKNTLDDLVSKNAQKYNVNPAFIRAVIEQESGGDPNAVSPTGATGLMQLTKTTAAQYNVQDRTNPEQNVEAGTQLFSELLNRYKDPRLAYAAYYSGPGAIQNGQIVSTNDHTAEDTAKKADHYMHILETGATFPKAPQAVSSKDMDKTMDNRMSIDDWVKGDPSAASDMEKFMGALNATDGKYGVAMKHLIASGQGDAAGRVASLLGGPDAIRAHDDYVVTQQKERDAEIQEQKAAHIAANKQSQDEAMSAITQSYLVQPDSYTFKPEYMNADMNTLRNNLQAQGVKIPTNFPALYMIGHYNAPASTLPARTWQKGAPNEMDAQTGLSYINQFINPEFDTKNYPTAQRVMLENSSGNYKNGAAIQNAGVAAQHLNLLLEANKALNNGNIQLVNRIANELGGQVGKDAITTYKSMVPIVAQEVEKVAAGGTAPYEEAVRSGKAAISSDLAPNQLENTVKSWTQLMYGRINAIDENTYSILQKHLHNVPSEATNLFQRYNLETPWMQQQQQGQQNQPRQQTGQLLPGQRQGEIAVRDQRGNVIGFTLPGKTGYRPIQTQ